MAAARVSTAEALPMQPGAGAVVRPVRDPECDLLDSLDHVVGGLGGAVGVAGLVRGGDLVPPAHDGASEGLHLRWAGVILEVDAELSDELARDVGVVDGADLADDFFGVPGGADLAARSPASSGPRSLASLSGSRRSWAMVISLRIR